MKLKQLQGDINTEDGKTILDIYDALFSSTSSYLADDTENAAKKLLILMKVCLKNDYAKKVYNRIKRQYFRSYVGKNCISRDILITAVVIMEMLFKNFERGC